MTKPHNFEPIIKEWLATLCTDSEILRLLEISVGRVLIRCKVEDYQKHRSLAENMRDWLVSQIKKDSQWLRRLDPFGRPKKLMKYSTVDSIMHDLRKAHAIDDQARARIELKEDDEEFTAALDNGFHLVRLMTPRALERESGLLQNCLHRPEYADRQIKAEFEYYVLRDSRSRSHAAIQVRSSDRLVREIKGKQNRPPILRYFLPIARYLNHRGWPVRNRWSSGLLIGSTGHVYHTELICLSGPVDLHGDLVIDGCKNVHLPEILRLSGELRISHSEIASAAALIEANSIMVSQSSGSTLATHITTSDHLMLTEDADFPEFGDIVSVGGNLTLGGNGHIREMPGLLTVKGFLDITRTVFPKLGRCTLVEGVLAAGASRVEHRYALDCWRVVLQVDDFVTIVGDMTAPHFFGSENLNGRTGIVVETYGTDGCLVALERYPEAAKVPILSSKLSRVIEKGDIPEPDYEKTAPWTVVPDEPAAEPPDRE